MNSDESIEVFEVFLGLVSAPVESEVVHQLLDPQQFPVEEHCPRLETVHVEHEREHFRAQVAHIYKVWSSHLLRYLNIWITAATLVESAKNTDSLGNCPCAPGTVLRLISKWIRTFCAVPKGVFLRHQSTFFLKVSD